MRLVFLGSGAFGVPTLAHLAHNHDIAAVVSQPDRPAGRGGRIAPTPVSRWARSNIPSAFLFKPEDVNEPEVVSRLHALEADAWVIVAFGQKLSPELLAGERAINLHASLLPRWRGAAPINHAILAGDTITGNSMITIARRMDAGRILAQSERAIVPDQTAGDLHDLLAEDGPELVESVLDDLGHDRVEGREQDESLVTRAPKLSRSDGWIDFAQPGERCRCRINGLSPWPGVTARLGEAPLKLLRAKPAPPGTESKEAAPGGILHPDEGIVACAPGTAIQLLEVQPPGKRPMRWDEFCRGHRVSDDDTFEGTPPC